MKHALVCLNEVGMSRAEQRQRRTRPHAVIILESYCTGKGIKKPFLSTGG
ncbi:hypothetical protein KCP76_05385 [Salmonella enterica subsp. enterica serovar Weltevreden]|nr:hypothetical protein KCP76_05385 [Salmonella enterica subsp. enterica serovar Weltevreden]